MIRRALRKKGVNARVEQGKRAAKWAKLGKQKIRQRVKVARLRARVKNLRRKSEKSGLSSSERMRIRTDLTVADTQLSLEELKLSKLAQEVKIAKLAI